MNLFVTRLSKYCYYGNIINILNYYGEQINEAELVLISGTLNCELHFDDNLFLGILNESCEKGLKQIGYQINNVNNNYSDYKFLLDNNTPILLSINSGVLTHNNIFKGTNKDHYIILLEENNQSIKISDSFVPTIPKSLFVGNMEKHIIQCEIQAKRASGIYLKKKKAGKITPCQIKDLFTEYIKLNACCGKNSIICNLKTFCDIALNNSELIINQDSLKLLSYDIKVAGVVARFDYIIELFNNYFDYPIGTEVLLTLKSKWELIASKLMKCSMTLKKDYFVNIFETEIPGLINNELCFYKNVKTNYIKGI